MGPKLIRRLGSGRETVSASPDELIGEFLRLVGEQSVMRARLIATTTLEPANVGTRVCGQVTVECDHRMLADFSGVILVSGQSGAPAYAAGALSSI